MQYVADKFYYYLHYALTAIAALSLLVYAGFYFTQPEVLATFGLTVLTAGIAALHLLYALVLFRLVARRSLRNGTFLSLLIFTLNLVGTIHLSGAFASPYYGLWLGLIIAAGLMGTYVLIGSAFMISIYYIMTCAPALGDGMRAGNCELLVGASWLAAVIGYLVWRGQWLDVSETAHVRRLSGQLNQQQLQSQILLHSIGDGVVITDLNGVIQYFNPAAAQITEWNESDATNLDYHLVMPLTDEQNQPLTGQTDPFRQAFTRKESVARSDVVLFTRSKQAKNLSLSVSPVIDENGVISGGIAVFRDISKEKQVERERNEFISTASHEMRTPVAAIEGYLALAANPQVSQIDANAQQYIEKAHDETKHLGALFRDLLSVTKLEDQAIPSNPTACDLNQIIAATIDELRFAAEKKQLKLNFKLSSEVPSEKTVKPLYYVYADPERLREVLTNLIDNAIKFTPSGGVEVTLTGDNSFATVGVHDNGVGIAPEDLRHLFQKFYRIDNSATRKVGGTGLGLYISRKIVEMYNGRIWAESTPDEGSHFYFSLPRLGYEKAQQLRASEPPATASTTPNAAGTEVAAQTQAQYNET